MGQKNHYLYSVMTTHDDFDSANPSSMWNACHIWTQLNYLSLLSARCSGGHGFDSCRGLMFSLSHACAMLINLSFRLQSCFQTATPCWLKLHVLITLFSYFDLSLFLIFFITCGSSLVSSKVLFCLQTALIAGLVDPANSKETTTHIWWNGIGSYSTSSVMANRVIVYF